MLKYILKKNNKNINKIILNVLEEEVDEAFYTQLKVVS